MARPAGAKTRRPGRLLALGRPPGAVTTTAPVPVREAERADLLDIARIERASFPQPWPFEAFTGFLGEPGFLVAEGPGGTVRGYVVADVVSDFGRPMGHVKDLAVAPAARGRGLGTRLLERALAVLGASGASRVKLEVRASNEAARSLYARFGFRRDRVVPGYYDDGEDALLLVADLDR